MATTIQYINPLFFNNMSPGIIDYNKTYPYVELASSLLDVSGGTVEEYDNVSLLEAKKRGILDPSVVGFYFRINFTETFDDDAIIGKVGYYKKGTGTQVISSGTSVSFKYNLYLFKNNNDIPESGWYSKEDDDYQGEFDYVEFSITDNDYNQIKDTKINLMDKIAANTGNFKPGYSKGTWQYEHDDGMFNNHAIEFYFYIWEEINGPWFTQNGVRLHTIPLIDQLYSEDGVINLKESNSDYTSTSQQDPIGQATGQQNHRKIYTLNYTSDFASDSSSNYIKVYKMTGHRFWNDGMPLYPYIRILAPKYSKFSFLWTYRVIDAGRLKIYEDPKAIEPRLIDLQGTPPLYSAGLKIGQEGIDDLQNWEWVHKTYDNWGRNITNYAQKDIFRIFKPKRKVEVRYMNQKLKITIPEKDRIDLSKNFIDRKKPDGRGPPSYKTWEGDIYIHPYENGEIVKTWFNIYIFENHKDHKYKLLDNTYTGAIDLPILETEPIEISYNLDNTVREVIGLIEYGQVRLIDSFRSNVTSFIKGNIYYINVGYSFLKDNNVDLAFSLTEDGEHNGGLEYKLGITLQGGMGEPGGRIRMETSLDYPNKLYYYNKNEEGWGTVIDMLSGQEHIREYGNIHPYTDLFVDISANTRLDISDNPINMVNIPDCNFDYYDVGFDDRGTLAYKDSSGNGGNLLIEDLSLANVRVNEREWFAYEEYTPENTQILRSILDDYRTLPRWVHILDVPPGAGWRVNWKYYDNLPETNDVMYDISDNEYYIRWSYTQRSYSYDKAQPSMPTSVSITDVSYNHGISPYKYFDFTQYGKIYEPKQVQFLYEHKEYPNDPGKFYKNLHIYVDSSELPDLSNNIVYNTDLGCRISIQLYILKPKNKTDRDQLDPIIDLSSADISGGGNFDLSYNLDAGFTRFPSSFGIDISDNGIKETTLLPGRYVALWSYTVIHNFINPKAREYPLIPGTDYDASANSIDITYNDFLYNNDKPYFLFPFDLSRMTLEISANEILELMNIRDTYLHTFGDNTEIRFHFLLWSPNYEHTQLLSGDKRWELPKDFQGPDDPRIHQVPVEYTDLTTIMNLEKIYLGNDNSDSIGSLYNWGFGGEPGIQYRKVTYHDISNNEVYQRKQYITIDTSNNHQTLDHSTFWMDPSATSLIIDFLLPGTTDLSMASANWGFGADGSGNSGGFSAYTQSNQYRGSFHIGIVGNGIDTEIYDISENGITVQRLKEGFIYKPPWYPWNNNYYYRYRFTEGQDYKVRYWFQETKIWGEDEPRKDLTIFVNGEQIYDLPGEGVSIRDISYIGQSMDISNQRMTSRPVDIEIFWPELNSTKTLLRDLSNTTIIRNTFVPQDFDPNDTETQFYESQNYETNGLYVPYIARWEYDIYDPSSNMRLSSSIIATDFFNDKQRLADWKIINTLDGGERIDINGKFPFEHKYKYAVLYSIPAEFIPPVPLYPTQELDLSYNEITRELEIRFDNDRIIYPLMRNLLDYWKLGRSETDVRFIIYAWKPYSTKLPTNYDEVTDLEPFNLWDSNVYDISFEVQSSSPYQLTNILPKIPHNVYRIREESLIYGKWVFAWNYIVENRDYYIIDKMMPDYGFFDVSASEIEIPPILYNPLKPKIETFTDPSNNMSLKIEIPQNQLLELSENVNTQLAGLTNVESIKINVYVWTPDKEIDHDPSGWELPYGFIGDNDNRLQSVPIRYYDWDEKKNKIYGLTPKNNNYGYDISKAYVKSLITTDLSKITDLSCVYFDYNEIYPNPRYRHILGNLPYSNIHRKNSHVFSFPNIPYISRWSYEIIRTGLPSYYSDISNNQYYRKPFWTVITDNDGNEDLENYEKVVRYQYDKAYIIRGEDPPEVIILTTNECTCPENEKHITKTKEALNKKLRKKAILENFKYAKRLRGKPAKYDNRAILYMKQNPNANVVFKYDDDSCP